MRAKVVILTAILALAVLVPAVYFHLKPNQPASTEAAPAPEVAAVTTPAKPNGPSILSRIQQKPSDMDIASAPAPIQMSKDPEEVKTQLISLGMSDDPAALPAILSQVENPNPDVVQTALMALKDYGSRDAIPTLQKELSYNNRPIEELMEIKNTIDFLSLPKFGEDSADTATIIH